MGLTPERPIDRLEKYEQRYSFSCGPASLVIAYKALGRHYTEERIMKECDLTLNGTDWTEMITHVIEYAGYGSQFRSKSNWETMKGTFEARGNPIVVAWSSDRARREIHHVLEAEAGAHFSVIKDITDDEITLFDPGFGDEYTMPRKYFEERWYDEITERAFLEIQPQ